MSSTGLLAGYHCHADIDWLETAGCLEFSSSSVEAFQRLDHAVNEAQEAHGAVLLAAGGRGFSVHQSGFGHGKQARMSYKVTYANVTIGLSPWASQSRRLPSFSITIPGDGCLLLGAKQAREIAHDFLRFMGGLITDEWIRRLDLCLDVAGLDIRDELVPAFIADQYICSSKKWNLSGNEVEKTGFSVGSRKNGGRRLVVYDKLTELKEKPAGELLIVTMADRRWGGKVPEAATRLEYSAGTSFFSKHADLRTADAALGRLNDIAGNWTSEKPRPFFRLTDRVVDRKNGHQSRCETLPLWHELMSRFPQAFGTANAPFVPLKRGTLKHQAAFKAIRGYLTKAAAISGFVIEGIDHACECLRHLHESNFAEDEDWFRHWEKHARAVGTLEQVMQFP